MSKEQANDAILWIPDELPTVKADQARYLDLCYPTFYWACWHAAVGIAMHRMWLEDPSRDPMAIGEDWEDLGEAVCRERVYHEFEQLKRMSNQLGEHHGLTAWIEGPTREGWALPAGIPSGTYTRATFDRMLIQDRQGKNRERGAGDPVATLWRRHVPGWRRTLSGWRADELDRQLSNHLIRVEAYFGLGPAP